MRISRSDKELIRCLIAQILRVLFMIVTGLATIGILVIVKMLENDAIRVNVSLTCLIILIITGIASYGLSSFCEYSLYVHRKKYRIAIKKESKNSRSINCENKTKRQYA